MKTKTVGSRFRNFLMTCCLDAVGGVAGSLAQAEAAPLQVGYSDWPGWVAWQVALDKGWFKDAGVDVSFQWFDYSASLDAFASGKLDAVTATNGDVLVTGSGGHKGVIVLVGDYSNGNDMIIGAPGVTSVKDLKGSEFHRLGPLSRAGACKRPARGSSRGSSHGRGGAEGADQCHERGGAGQGEAGRDRHALHGKSGVWLV